MASEAPWSPTAHAFAQHQFSHVANFWKQGRTASFQLKALPGGQAELNLTFRLPSASQVIPPSSLASPVPAPQRSIHPLFPKGCPPQRSGAELASPKKVSSRQRKSYRRSVLHRAALAAPSLPPPKDGSLRQAALVSVQHMQADSASPTQSTKKRSYSESHSPSALSPSNFPPLAQRIRSDLQIGEESPERELLRTRSTPLKFPSPSSPRVKGFPPPAPLAFTPSKFQEGFETQVTQLERSKDAELFEKAIEVAESEVEKVLMTTKEEPAIEKCDESDWETIEDSDDGCENDFPAIDVSCDNWEEKFNESVKRFHNIVNCENCDGLFTPDHQC